MIVVIVAVVMAAKFFKPAWMLHDNPMFFVVLIVAITIALGVRRLVDIFWAG